MEEGLAKRGSNNIASCIWRYIKTNTTKEFVFFSDNCGGQNKNRPVTAMYMHAVATLNVYRISHYYLERGHTENEGDSTHSTIERAARRVNIYTPMQWYAVVASAKRQGEAYSVVEMADKMKDFKPLCECYFTQSPKCLLWSKTSV